MTIQRIQLSRAGGWRKPENTLTVSRPTIWGNPWIGPDAVEAYRMFMEQVVSGVMCVSLIEDELKVTRKFDKPIVEWGNLRIAIFEYVKQPVDVACWCPLDRACHGNVIKALPYLFAWNRATRSGSK